MTELNLKCDTCNRQLTLNSTNPSLQFFIENYGQIDKVTGRVYEIPCPLCIGVMGKTEG